MTSEQLPFYIGRYKVTGRLGSGGMGVVYLATDERLHRQVAIKRLVKNPSSSNAHLRIRKEALLLAQLNHANIVQIYDVVEESSDIALVMEYVDGCSLSQWQRERNPSLQQKIRLLKQISNGLARAHSAGIIHRDLKSDNILIDDNNTAKITDFGIAKSWRENSDLTREQHVAGSWGAMSPEQATGQPLDNRSDLFSLGVLAYRLLCDQNPFGDCDSPFTTVDRIVNSQHPPAAKLNPELPAALSQLLDRLLTKNPDKRPLNAAAVAAELDAVLQSLDQAEVDSFSRTATITAEAYHRKQQNRGHWRKALIGAIAAGCTTLLIAAAVLIPRPAPQPEAGRYIAIVAPDESALTSHETSLLINNVLSAIKQGLSNREGLLLVPYTESMQVRGQPLRKQARQLNAQLLVHPDLSCDRSRCEVSLELIDTESFAVVASRSTSLELGQSLNSRARTLQQISFLLPNNPQRDANSNINISAADYQTYLELFENRTDYTETEKTLRTLEELQKRTPDFPPYYELAGLLATDVNIAIRSTETVEILKRFLQRTPSRIADHPSVLRAELILAMYSEDPGRAEALLDRLKVVLPDRADYHYLRSAYHQYRSEYEEALRAIDRALALRTSVSYLTQKALALTNSGDMDGAKPILLQSLEMGDNQIGTISLLASNELDGGRPDETIRLLSEYGIDRLGSADLYNLCLAYYIERQFERADRCLSGLYERTPEDPDPLLYRAQIARTLQKPEKARALAERALALTDGHDDWETLLLRARAYAELGQASRAVETLMETRRSAPDILYVLDARAQVYFASGDYISAKALMRRALERDYSPIWFATEQFAPLCKRPDFADLRSDYPQLCSRSPQDMGVAGLAQSDEAPQAPTVDRP